jgi:transcriptional regulator with PAS, ATPase and Fis domain
LIVVGDDQAAGNVPGAFASSEEERAALRWKVEQLREQVLRDQRERSRSDHDDLFEKSPRMKAIKQMIEQVADTDVTVLIWGESGVGKELVARAIHDSSVRRAGACIKVNCAALPPALLESELFGYERGAFTGAHRKKPGKFELADGGTMFLDEIGEMPLSLQAKLLQVLQDREFSRLADRDIKVDVASSPPLTGPKRRWPDLSRRSLLPPQRRQYPRPPAPRPARGDPAPRRALLPEVHAPVQPATHAPLSGDPGALPGPLLAR